MTSGKKFDFRAKIIAQRENLLQSLCLDICILVHNVKSPKNVKKRAKQTDRSSVLAVNLLKDFTSKTGILNRSWKSATPDKASGSGKVLFFDIVSHF